MKKLINVTNNTFYINDLTKKLTDENDLNKKQIKINKTKTSYHYIECDCIIYYMDEYRYHIEPKPIDKNE